MSKINPWDFLEEMLHSIYYEDVEREKGCPVCNYPYPTHRDLIRHIIDRHPKYIRKYVSDIDILLHDPVTYLSVLNEYCAFCGERFFSKPEFKRHLLTHKSDVKRFKEEFGEKNE